MTTPIEQFNIKDCEKIDALCVNAYTTLLLDPENPTGVILDTSWGQVKVDLKSIVKAGETVTHLYLAPVENPEGLCYEKEDGTTDYIPGDELSRIISMRLLKDVDQTVAPVSGDVYMYNENDGLFHTYNLQTFIDVTNQHLTNIDATLANHQQQINQLGTRVTNLENRMTAAENRITAVENRVSDIEGLIYNYPTDKTTKIPRGNVNVYGDIGNTGNHSNGIFTHNPNSNITNDLYFS